MEVISVGLASKWFSLTPRLGKWGGTDGYIPEELEVTDDRTTVACSRTVGIMTVASSTPRARSGQTESRYCTPAKYAQAETGLRAKTVQKEHFSLHVGGKHI